jgi:hypothetical protein
MEVSYAVIPAIRQVGTLRLHVLITQASPAVMTRIDAALALSLAG